MEAYPHTFFWFRCLHDVPWFGLYFYRGNNFMRVVIASLDYWSCSLNTVFLSLKSLNQFLFSKSSLPVNRETNTSWSECPPLGVYPITLIFVYDRIKKAIIAHLSLRLSLPPTVSSFTQGGAKLLIIMLSASVPKLDQLFWKSCLNDDYHNI